MSCFVLLLTSIFLLPLGGSGLLIRSIPVLHAPYKYPVVASNFRLATPLFTTS